MSSLLYLGVLAPYLYSFVTQSGYHPPLRWWQAALMSVFTFLLLTVDRFEYFLYGQEAIEVVGAAANGQEALEQAVALCPDVILMDVRMPVMDGVVATAQVRSAVPSCRILMLTTFDDDEYVLAALQAGASGYLLKDLPAPDLASAVQAVYKGIYQLDPAVASKVIAALARPQISDLVKQAGVVASTSRARGEAGTPSPRPTDLTGREVEVLRLIAKGATNREIAEESAQLHALPSSLRCHGNSREIGLSSY